MPTKTARLKLSFYLSFSVPSSHVQRTPAPYHPSLHLLSLAPSLPSPAASLPPSLRVRACAHAHTGRLGAAEAHRHAAVAADDGPVLAAGGRGAARLLRRLGPRRRRQHTRRAPRGGGGVEGRVIRIGQVEGVDGWGLGWGGGVDWGREWGAVCDLRRDRLSRRAGVRKVSVWAWESGERAPKLASAWMLFRHSIAQRLDHTRSCAAAPTFAPANAQHLLPSSLTRAHAHDRSSSTGR